MNFPFYIPGYQPQDPTSSWARSWSFNFGNVSSPPAASATAAPPPYTRFDPAGFGSGLGHFGGPYRTYCQPYWSGYGPPPPSGYFGQPGIGVGASAGAGASVYGGFNTNRVSSSGGDHNGEKEAGSESKDFEVRIDVSNYEPEELTVKTVSNTKIIVEAYKERQGVHTASARAFEKSYKLPVGIPLENLRARITPDGKQLILSAKRPAAASSDANANATWKETNVKIESKKNQ